VTKLSAITTRQPAAHNGSEDRLYDQLHRAIVERRLEPGVKLGEGALCEIYGVSRAQIRRVLVDLSHAKVVELRPNRGAYVAQPSVREARHVFEARRAIEAAIVERAVSRVTDANLAKLKEIVDADRNALARGDGEASIKLSGDFHLCLGEIAGNQVLSEILAELVSRSSLIIATYGRGKQSDCSADEHGRLIEALRQGDADKAAATMAEHLNHIESLLNLTSDEPVEPADLRSILLGEPSR
jgi:DNA-binding GntR family transcriptional regulator